ncbi:MAG: hypothetical protein DMF50_04035 [Acidobacteria bacterium]|nr:MAG: hypothetical protein DMF50_04035 [Acidobacteriota bacterium]
MNGARSASAPAFASAILATGAGGTLRPRRLGTTIGVSILLHTAAAGGLVLLSLLTVEPVPEPPILIRFLAAAPPAPRLVPLRETRDLPQPPPPRARPLPPPAAALPALRLTPIERPRPEPPPLKAEALDLPRSGADPGPAITLRDSAPPRPRPALPALGRLAAGTTLSSGSEEPDLVFLVPGKARPQGPGGGIAGRGDGLPALPGAEASPGGGGGRRGGGPGGDARGLETEAPIADTGLGSFLGRKYGATLVEAARLGQRTSDGARYNLLVPMLSEAYRRIGFRGAWRGADGDTVQSAQVSAGEVAIRYRDGTLHVVVPTGDGLVALYVSTEQAKGAERSKVGEAERALAALRRLAEGRT